jgi:hypothetical protein
VSTMHGIEHAFDVGAEVLVLTDRAQGVTWERAVVTRLEPYRGRPGYYVSYPYAKEQWECHGGWKPEQHVREKEVP